MLRKVWQCYVVKWIQNNEVDKCIYVRNTDKIYVIICLYMDDMLILDSNDHMIKSTRKMLNNKLDMKDLRVANIILRIKNSKKYNGLNCLNFIMLRKFSRNSLKMTIAL